MKKINISKEELDNAVKKFNTKEEIADFFGISTPTMSRILKDNNITTDIRHYKVKLELLDLCSKVSKEYLEENYVNTDKSLREITEELGLPPRSLEKVCAHYQLLKPYKYKFNKDKFYNLQDPNVYYLAGLIATDGSIDSDAKCVYIGLVGESELKLLTDINNYFEYNRPVSITIKKDNYKIYSISYSDKYIREFYYENFKIPKINKTFTLDFPDYFYNDMCLRAYILGCLDGDGCITHLNKSPDIGILSASEQFMSKLSKTIENKLNINTNYKADKYYSIRIYKKDAIKFLDWVYEYNGFRLNRKYEKYLKAKDIVCSAEQH